MEGTPEAQELSEAAKALYEAAKKTDWVYVDAHIESVEAADFAWFETVGLSDKDPNVQDLAATVLANPKHAISDRTREHLRRIVTLSTHPAVKFRAAVALSKQNAPSAGVREVLEAVRDMRLPGTENNPSEDKEAMAEIAKKTLDELWPTDKVEK